jgi:hypothetical protein
MISPSYYAGRNVGGRLPSHNFVTFVFDRDSGAASSSQANAVSDKKLCAGARDLAERLIAVVAHRPCSHAEQRRHSYFARSSTRAVNS